MSKFTEGDIVKVTESHDRIREGSFWRLDIYVPEETDDNEDGTPTVYPAYWIADSTDGMRTGHPLDEDKIERITEDIPFSVYAKVLVEVVSTIKASSEEEAFQIARDNYRELLTDNDEMYGYVSQVYLNE